MLSLLLQQQQLSRRSIVVNSSFLRRYRRQNPFSLLSFLCCWVTAVPRQLLLSSSSSSSSSSSVVLVAGLTTTGGSSTYPSSSSSSSSRTIINSRRSTTRGVNTCHRNNEPDYYSTTATMMGFMSKNSKESCVEETGTTEPETTAPSSYSIWDDGKDDAINKCILPLDTTSYKGSSGRVAIVGGSADYTGAPYYAAMSALQVGVDLAYVLTANEAAMPIKCYSPELMVSSVYSAQQFDTVVLKSKMNVDQNLLDNDEARELVNGMVDKVISKLDRLHCLIIGPGLGRCPLVQAAVSEIVKYAISRELYMVFDADALYMLSQPQYRNLIQNYNKVVLTPNVVEYERLFGTTDTDDGNSGDTDSKEKDKDDEESENDIAFGSAVIIKKGLHDIIYSGTQTSFACKEQGGLKRSGGIGDVLSGTVGALVAWHSILQERRKKKQQQQEEEKEANNNNNDSSSELIIKPTDSTDTAGTSKGEDDTINPDLTLACWTACCFVKRATRQAYDLRKRSMTAPDVLNQLGSAIDSMTTTTADTTTTRSSDDDKPSSKDNDNEFPCR